MSVLNVDRVWSRVSKRPDFQGKPLSKFRPQVIGKQFTATNGQLNQSATVDFPSLAVILGICGGVAFAAGAASTPIRDLSGVRISIDWPSSDGSLITGGKMNGNALFGPTNQHQFPAIEIVIPVNNTLTVGVDNLTTSTITFDIAFHCLIFRAS